MASALSPPAVLPPSSATGESPDELLPCPRLLEDERKTPQCFMRYLRSQLPSGSWQCWRCPQPISFAPLHGRTTKYRTLVTVQLRNDSTLRFHLNFKCHAWGRTAGPQTCSLSNVWGASSCGSCACWARPVGSATSTDSAAAAHAPLKAALHFHGYECGFQRLDRGGGGSRHPTRAPVEDDVFVVSARRGKGERSTIQYVLSLLLPSSIDPPTSLSIHSTWCEHLFLSCAPCPDWAPEPEEPVALSSPSSSSSSSSSEDYVLVRRPSPESRDSGPLSSSLSSPSSSSSFSSSSSSFTPPTSLTRHTKRRRRATATDPRVLFCGSAHPERIWVGYLRGLQLFKRMWSPLELVLTPLNFCLFRAITHCIHRFHRLVIHPDQNEGKAAAQLWRDYIDEGLLTATRNCFAEEQKEVPAGDTETDRTMLPSARYQLRELRTPLPAKRTDGERKDFLVFVQSELAALFCEVRHVVQPNGEAAPAPLQYGKNDVYDDVQRRLSDSSALRQAELVGMTPTELSLMDVTVELERLKLSAPSAPSAGEEKVQREALDEGRAALAQATQRFLPVDRKLWLMGAESLGHTWLQSRILPQFKAVVSLYGVPLLLQYRTRDMRLQLEAAFRLTDHVDAGTWTDSEALRTELAELASAVWDNALLAVDFVVGSPALRTLAVQTDPTQSYGQRMQQLLRRLPAVEGRTYDEAEIQRRIARGILHQLTSFCLVAEAPFQPPWSNAAEELTMAEALFGVHSIGERDAKGVAVTRAMLNDLRWYEQLLSPAPPPSFHITKPDNDFCFVFHCSSPRALKPLVLEVELSNGTQRSQLRLPEAEKPHTSYRYLLPRLERMLKQQLKLRHGFEDGPRAVTMSLSD